MSFLIVLYSAYSNLCKLHLKSEIFPWRGGEGGGGGLFYGPSVWPDIFAFSLLSAEKSM